MLEETARVVVIEGEFAQVETERQTSCGACAAKSACGTSLLAQVFGARRATFRVLNPIDAKRGELVIVGLEDAALTRGSFAFYIVPILSLFLFAIGGELLAETLDSRSTEPVSILSGVLGLLIGLGWVRRYALKIRHDRRYQAVILRRASLSVPTVEVSLDGH